MGNGIPKKMTLAEAFKKQTHVVKPARDDDIKPIEHLIQREEQKEEQHPNPARKQKATTAKGKSERSYQPFTVICDKELVRKVKAIARKEGLHVNAVVQAMYQEGINSYERIHGNIDNIHNHRSAKEVLFSS